MEEGRGAMGQAGKGLLRLPLDRGPTAALEAAAVWIPLIHTSQNTACLALALSSPQGRLGRPRRARGKGQGAEGQERGGFARRRGTSFSVAAARGCLTHKHARNLCSL